MAKDFQRGLRIAITGHRVYPDRAALYSGLDRFRAREYIFGGARGVDSDALQYIARTQPRSIRTVVVPNRVIDQPIDARAIIRRHATRVIELRNSGSDRYMIRNRFMVDRATRVQAFYDFRGRGGTYNTIEYANSIGRNVTIQPMISFNIDSYTSMTRPQFNAWVNTVRRQRVSLSSLKRILLHMIRNVYHTSVGDFSNSIGVPGVKTLEGLWRR